ALASSPATRGPTQARPIESFGWSSSGHLSSRRVSSRFSVAWPVGAQGADQLACFQGPCRARVIPSVAPIAETLAESLQLGAKVGPGLADAFSPCQRTLRRLP